VVRFTDVDPERVKSLKDRIEQSDGPPEGIPATGLQMLLDEDQKTAVVLQMFSSADDMRAAEAAFDGMDASETPGTRASVDRCEQTLDMQMP